MFRKKVFREPFATKNKNTYTGVFLCMFESKYSKDMSSRSREEVIL